MIIKWIVCQVSSDKIEEFSFAQEGWKALKGVNGFLGQIGGWDLNNRSNACIMGLWENMESYKHFMDHVHDEIFYHHYQGKSYESISVTLYECLFNIEGIYQLLTDALPTSTFLQVDEIIIIDNREQHFIKAQQEIWNPEIGMYAGAIGKAQGNRYLVSTLWKDPSSHQNDIEKSLPTLRGRRKMEKDDSSIQERLIVLEPKWTVI